MKQNHEQNHRYCVYLSLLEECSCSGLFRAERALSLSPFVPAVGSKTQKIKKIKLSQKAARTGGYCGFKIQTSAKGGWYGLDRTEPAVVALAQFYTVL